MLTTPLLLAALAGQTLHPVLIARPADGVGVAAAAALAGKRAVVCGRVATVVSPATAQDVTTLTLTDGAAAVLAVVIPAADRSGFPAMFERLLVGREICTQGTVEAAGQGLELRARDVNQFRFIGPPVPSPDFAPSVVRAGRPRVVSTTLGASRPPAGFVDPVPLSEGLPKYTPAAMKAKIQGEVELDVLVGTTGSVESVQLVRSLDPLFGMDDEAVRAALKWKFQPARQNGNPVPAVVALVLTFKLH